MTVVDNNVLSALAKIERLDLIDGTFNDVSTTPGVIEELDTARLEGYRFVERIDDIRGMEGWLDVVIPTEEERTLAENIRDHSLSFVDAQCIAIANLRSEKLLTDDRHVGTVADARGVVVWDLPLLLEACARGDTLSSEGDIRAVLSALEARDNYRFSSADRNALFDAVD